MKIEGIVIELEYDGAVIIAEALESYYEFLEKKKSDVEEYAALVQRFLGSCQSMSEDAAEFDEIAPGGGC